MRKQSLQEALSGVNLQWFAEGDDTFDPEQLQTYLNTDEGKQWFSQFSSSLGLRTQEQYQKDLDTQVKGLKENQEKWKKEALQFKDARDQMSRLSSILTEYEIGVDEEGKIDLSRLEEFVHKSKNPGQDDKSGEIERSLRKATRDLESRSKEIERLSGDLGERAKDIEERDGFISRVLIDNELHSALREAGYSEFVIKSIIPHLKATSKAVVQVDEEDGGRKAVTDDGRAIGDWISWWKDTDEGKALRLSAANNGGGAGGSGTGDDQGSGKPVTYEQLLSGLFK